MHILRKLGDRGVTANMLKEIAHDTKKTLKGEGIELLKEVFRVRKLEERYERGEVGKHFISELYVSLLAY